jgi:beta-glucosidase
VLIETVVFDFMRVYVIANSSNLEVSPSNVNSKADSVTVSVTVTNTGSRSGKEVIQVYATDDRSSVVTPNQELVGFSKVEIE